jgi:hypothetical protein
MHAILVGSLALSLVLVGSPASAQDAEALRRELEQLQRQLRTMQEQYQNAIDRLTERLQRLEVKPQVAAAPPSLGGEALTLPRLLDWARPHEPFSLYAQAAAGPGVPGAAAAPARRGQFLFDMGIAGDFIANVTSSPVERDQVGTFAGRENRILPREIELSFFGQVDPYARAAVILEAAEDFEEGERALEFGLAEAYLELISLPWGFQVRGGRERLRFGLLNEFHLHDRPQPDSPVVLTRFFGEEGLTENGAELVWVAPLPVYLQAIVGIFDGDNEDAFGYGSLRDPLLSARLRTFFELGPAGALQLGVSGLYGRAADGPRASYVGVDAKYKYTPAGWSHALLTVGGEVLFAHRKVSSAVENGGEGGGAAVAQVRHIRQDRGEAVFATRDAYGYYVWADVQPWRQWLFGLRHDWTEFPTGPGHEWALEPYLAWMPSEFLRFRLGYKYTSRSDFGSGPDTLSELFFQATFLLGAHPAHPF